MSEQITINLTEDELRDISYVDLAYEILSVSGNSFHYKDLLLEIGRLKELSQELLEEIMPIIYSEINIDGRFTCPGDNVWGLQRWYPTEKLAAKASIAPKRFRRNDDDYEDYDLDDDFYLEDSDDLEDSASGSLEEDEEDIDARIDDELPEDLTDDLNKEFQEDLEADLEDDLEDDVEEDVEEDVEPQTVKDKVLEEVEEGYDILEREAELEDDDDDEDLI